MSFEHVFYFSGGNEIADEFIFLLPLFLRGKFFFTIDIFDVLDSGNFSPVRFFVRFKSEMEHRHERIPPLRSQPQVQGSTATGKFYPPLNGVPTWDFKRFTK